MQDSFVWQSIVSSDGFTYIQKHKPMGVMAIAMPLHHLPSGVLSHQRLDNSWLPPVL